MVSVNCTVPVTVSTVLLLFALDLRSAAKLFVVMKPGKGHLTITALKSCFTELNLSKIWNKMDVMIFAECVFNVCIPTYRSAWSGLRDEVNETSIAGSFWIWSRLVHRRTFLSCCLHTRSVPFKAPSPKGSALAFLLVFVLFALFDCQYFSHAPGFCFLPASPSHLSFFQLGQFVLLGLLESDMEQLEQNCRYADFQCGFRANDPNVALSLTKINSDQTLFLSDKPGLDKFTFRSHISLFYFICVCLHV